MSFYLVPQWFLPRTYDWVDPYRLVCVPMIAGLLPLVYCLSERFGWTILSPGMPDVLLDWTGNYPLFRTTGMGTRLSRTTGTALKIDQCSVYILTLDSTSD